MVTESLTKPNMQFYWLCLAMFVIKNITASLSDDVSDSDVNIVRVRLSEEKSKRILLQNDVESLMLRMENLEGKLDDRPSEVVLPRSKSTPVHFNAKLTSFITLDAQHVIIFDKVLENVGKGYSVSTGIFRAPSSGAYLFTLSILSGGKAKYAHIQMMKNNEEIGRVFAGSDTSGWPQTGSAVITAHLTEGDEVYAREFPKNTGHLHGDDFCSFSGVLLQVDHH